MKIIPLKYDFCVKEVMENETVRKHFISDVLSAYRCVGTAYNRIEKETMQETAHPARRMASTV